MSSNRPSGFDLDVQTSPPEMVMRFLISAINTMGVNMLKQQSASEAQTPQEQAQRYNETLFEVHTLAERIDRALDTEVAGDGVRMGVMVLAVLQIAIMAMSTYIDTAEPIASADRPLDLELDRPLNDIDAAFEEADAKVAMNAGKGVLLRRKIRDDH